MTPEQYRQQKKFAQSAFQRSSGLLGKAKPGKGPSQEMFGSARNKWALGATLNSDQQNAVYDDSLTPKYNLLSAINVTVDKLFFKESYFARLDQLHNAVVDLDVRLTKLDDNGVAAWSADAANVTSALNALLADATAAQKQQSLAVAMLAGVVVGSTTYVVGSKRKWRHNTLLPVLATAATTVTTYIYSTKSLVK